jgi:hypothetical protein
MNSRKSLWLVGTTILAVILSSCNMGATPVPTEDPGVIQTQAFSVVLTQAALQQTQTALAIPPTPLPTNTPFPTATLGETPTLGAASTFAPLGGTNTPFAFNTQQPGLTPLASTVPTLGAVATFTTKNGCNDGTFMGESKPFDKDVIAAGKNFSKSWEILNTGTCVWDEGYSFAFLPDLSSPELKGYSIVLKKNAPEEYTKPKHSQTFVVKLTAPKTAGEYKGYWKMKDDAGNLFGPLVSVWITVPE